MDYTEQDIKLYIRSFPGDCILYHMPEGVLTVLDYTESIPATFGLSRGEYLTMRENGALAGVLESDREYVTQAIREMIAGPKQADIYFRTIHKTSGSIWLHVRGKVIGTYKGSLLFAAAYQKADMEFENLNCLLNNDKNFLCICDYETYELLYTNHAASEYLHRSDYAGQFCYRYIKGKDAPCETCAKRKLKNGESHIAEQYDPRVKRWYQIDCFETVWYGRKAFYNKICDITDQKRNRDLLDADNALIRRIAGTVFEFIAIINVNKRTISFRDVNMDSDNAAPARSSDYDADNLCAIEHLVVPEERAYCRQCAKIENLTEQLKESETYSYSFTQLGNEKNTFRKQLTFCWLDWRHEEIIAIKSDITPEYQKEQAQLKELREAVQSAELANRAKSEFLSRMSHDMRTPLNGILGLSELMVQKTDLTEIRQDISQLTLSGKYLLNLINDTLDVSKIESGQVELHPVPCSGKEVFDNMMQLFRPNLEEKRIEFLADVDDTIFTDIFIDVGRVEQVFMNIVGNAIKFTPEGGKIELIVKTLSFINGVYRDRITVRDNGIGMSEEFLPNIFEPFSQEYSSSKSQYQGTGLGMTIAKQIVQLMGGEISIKSKPGAGTECTFILNVPMATEAQLAQRTASPEKVDLECLSGRRVLLCEDNALNAKITIRMLQLHDIQADWAKDGEEGAELFKNSQRGTYDAILMDIRMPHMDGLEAARVIRGLGREDGKTIPIIAMTANAFDEDRENSRAAGMNAHLAKPISVQELFETLASVIIRAD